MITLITICSAVNQPYILINSYQLIKSNFKLRESDSFHSPHSSCDAMKYCVVCVLLCVCVSVVQGASESRGSESRASESRGSEENSFKEDSVDEIAGELSICPGEQVNF